VKSLIWVILAPGKRVNKSFRYSNGLTPCSPFRVPIARLAAAQAAIEEKKAKAAAKKK
jgi:hypothetical protein